MKYYKRNNCRLCKGKRLKKSLILNPSPWADDYVSRSNLSKKKKLVPLNLDVCQICGNVQLDHVIDQSEVYLNYTYETSSSLGLSEHFKKTAETIIKKYKPQKKSLVIDIGSNDGTLLSHFKKKDLKVLGIEPMSSIASIAKKNKIKTLVNFFSKNFSKKIKKNFGVASVISANNVVANIDNLDDFFEGIKNLMNKDSIFFFETFYLPLQIKNFVWDFIYHEHLSYFRIEPLKKYFKKLGLEIIGVETNNVKGGSMRCVIQLLNGSKRPDKSVENCISKEKSYGFGKKYIFEKFSNKIGKARSIFEKKIKNLILKKKTISGYGASATSTTLMHHYNINFLDSLYDDFKVKQGLYSPGFNVPVKASSKIYKDNPDCIIILAWRYKNQIIKKHKKFLKNGGSFIIPLPKYQLINSK